MFAKPKRKSGQWDGVAIAAVVLLAFSFVLGGASRDHELRLALVELSALPLLCLAILALVRRDRAPPSRLSIGILCALCALPLLQILPLPPGVWTHLPGRSQLVLALGLTDLTPGWAPLSLTPERTWRSFLALVPPVAMFLGVLATTAPVRLRLVQLLLGAVVLAMGLGSLQLMSGGDQFYPWRTTDAGNFVGFFANRNHMATLCLVSLPFALGLGARVMRTRSTKDRTVFWLAAMFVVLTIVALGVIRSRTGVILVAPVLGASLIAVWIASGRGRLRWPLVAMVSGATLAMVAVAAFALGPIMQRFDATGVREGRFENWPVVASVADAYLPVGSGLGSFDSVYRSVEPLDRLDASFFNQAHNEYLETWLEAGWPGAALIIAFLVWFARRSWTAWRDEVSTAGDLRRAASIAIGAVLLHSAVDYPLRTATMAVIMGLLCALLELNPRPGETVYPSAPGRPRSANGSPV